MSIAKDFAKDFFRIKVLINNMVSTFSIGQIRDVLIVLSQEKLKSGVDAFGNILETDSSERGVYSPFNPKNYAQNYVDLEDTGAFKDSFNVVVKNTFATLEADFNKGDSHIFDNFSASYKNEASFEEAILDLTNEDMTASISLSSNSPPFSTSLFLTAALTILKVAKYTFFLAFMASLRSSLILRARDMARGLKN